MSMLLTVSWVKRVFCKDFSSSFTLLFHITAAATSAASNHLTLNVCLPSALTSPTFVLPTGRCEVPSSGAADRDRRMKACSCLLGWGPSPN